MLRLAALASLGLSACVVGSEHAPSRLELSRAPAEPPGTSAAALAAPRTCRAPAAVERPPAPGPDAQWVEGFCRGTPQGFSWQDGHWESGKPPRSWK